jgi:hypothetical protein
MTSVTNDSTGDPGAASATISSKRRHTSQTAVARTSGPCTPCSCVQLPVAIASSVGTTVSARPRVSTGAPVTSARNCAHGDGDDNAVLATSTGSTSAAMVLRIR